MTLGLGGVWYIPYMGNEGFISSAVCVARFLAPLYVAPRIVPASLSAHYGLGSRVGSFRNLGVPYFGVLIIRILLFRVLY